jgi:serine/threonine protein kinase
MIQKIMLWKLNDKSTKMIYDEISIMEKLKNLRHKNIIGCYDIINKDNTIYMVLEYCDSGDLSKLIGKPIREEVVEYYFFQICRVIFE